MLFNSIDFAVFLPIVFALYWLLQNKGIKHQNILLLVASYFFYGWWDWTFLFLIIFSSLVDYIVGIEIYKTDNKKLKKRLLYLSLVSNLGILGFFKYFDFFIENFSAGFTLLGYPIEPYRLNFILPVGISFYTFQTLSYTIDIYKGHLKPTNNWIAFFGYVSFFPQLVAGPIERAKNLIPQFTRKRHFDHNKAIDGLRQMLWGFFKKVVLADNCAPYIHDIFSDVDNFHSPMLLVGMFLFVGQLYADFSGYSDIAIGCARLFGFELSKNFNYPAYSKTISEFWSRWHITLTKWFGDYVFIPILRYKRGGWMKVISIMILFLLIGFWHGARWTFIFYGFINAVVVIIQNQWAKRKVLRIGPFDNKVLSGLHLQSRIWSNYFLLMILCTFFRAESLRDGMVYIYRFFDYHNWMTLDIVPGRILSVKLMVILAIGTLVFEWFHQHEEHALEMKNKIFRISAFRWVIYFTMLFLIYQYRGVELNFIYFQF